MTHPADIFLSHVLPAEGPYTFSFRAPDPDGELMFRQRTVEDLQQLKRGIAKQVAMGHCTFYGISNYKTLIYGREMRNEDNVKSVRSVWHDVDVGENKQSKDKSRRAYMTREAAIAAVDKLVAEGKILAPTYYVNSGYGLHLYWCFDTDLDRSQWGIHAAQTHRALETHDPALYFDKTRLRDMSSVMRLPSTLNFKNPETPMPVEIIKAGNLWTSEHFNNFYGTEDLELILPQVKGRKSISAAGRMEMLSKTGLGIQPNYSVQPLYSIKGPLKSPFRVDGAIVLKTCKQMSYFAVNQNEQNYTHWRNMLGVTTATKQGRTLAHLISNKFAGYSKDEVDDKFDEWGAGFTRCDTIQAGSPRPELCHDCPFYQMKAMTPIKAATETTKLSPTVVAAPEAVAAKKSLVEIKRDRHGNQVEIIPPPNSFFMTDTSTCERYIDYNDEDEPVERTRAICKGRLSVNALAVGEISNTTSLSLSYQRHKDSDLLVGEIDLVDLNKGPGDVATSIAKCLPINLPTLAGQKHVRRYLHDCMEALYDEEFNLPVRFESGGWKDDGTFTLPYGQIKSDGDVSVARMSAELMESTAQIKQQGTVEGWRDAVQPMMNKDDLEVCTFGLLLGFAAPLMKFATHTGATVCFWGGAGSGKSTGLSLAHSVFGVADCKAISSSDSAGAVTRKIAKYRNTVAVWDEITTADSQQLGRVIFDVASGRPGDRLNRDSSIRSFSNMTWQTLLLTSSNVPLSVMADTKSSMGGQDARLWEVTTIRDQFTDDEKAAIATMFDALEENHGVAGPVFVHHVMNNIKDIKARIRKNEKRVRDNKYVLDGHRFAASAIAAMCTAGEIVNQLNLVEIDMSWLYRALNRNKPSQLENDENTLLHQALGMFNRTLVELERDTVVVYIDDKGDVSQVVNFPQNNGSTIKVRVEVTDNPKDTCIYVPSQINARNKQVVTNFEQAIAIFKKTGVIKEDDVIRKAIGERVVGQDGLQRIRAYRIRYGKVDPERFAQHCTERYRAQMKKENESNVVNMRR